MGIPWLLVRHKFPEFYFPRAIYQPEQQTFLSWIKPVYNAAGDELYKISGRKGLLFVRWKKQTMAFMSGIALLGGFVTLIYMYATPDDLESGFASTSAGSLDYRSAVLWLTFLFTIVLTFGFIFLIIFHRRDLQDSKNLSVKLEEEIFHRVVQLNNLPYTITSNEDLHQQLETICEVTIKQVSIAKKIKNIDSLQKKKRKAVQQVELYNEQEQQEGNIVMFSPPFHGKFPGKLCPSSPVRAVSYYENQAEKLTEKIEKVRQKALQSPKHAKVAFVIFEKRAIAESIVGEWDSLRKGDSRFEKCTAEIAKPYEEICWQNLGTNQRDHSVRKTISDLLIVGLAFVWTVPIAFLSNLDNLAQIPWVGQYISQVLLWNTALSGFIETIIPVLLTWLFHQLLPRFCVWISKYEKHPDLSSLHASAMEKYWIFVMLNGFVFYILFSSGIDFAKTLINNSGEIKFALENLDWSLYGLFYCTYLITMAFIDSAKSWIKPKDFVVCGFKWLVTEHKTEKRREIAFSPGGFSYHFKFAKESLFFVIVLTFSPIVPLVSLCAFLAYMLNYYADKTNVVLMAPRDPAYGKKLFLRFGLFLNCSMAITFVFWSFFFMSHEQSILAIVAPPLYALLWVISFAILWKTRKQRFSLEISESADGNVEDEKYYDWNYITSATRYEQDRELTIV